MRKAEPSQAITALSTEPPAGPTVMQAAHAEGRRKACAILRNRLTEPDRDEETLHATLVVYLKTWYDTYRQGVSESPSTVDRTILDIRRDTVAQILAELGRS